MLRRIHEVFRRRELLAMLVRRNLKIRYKGTILGFFWSLMTPLLMIAIYGTFAKIMRWNTGRNDYLWFLVAGIVVWQFLSTCLNDSLHAITGNSNLVKKTAFPRLILPSAMVLANAINFLLTGLVLVICLLSAGMTFQCVLGLPVVLLSQCALCLGMSLLISCSNVYFRDAEHILGVGTLAWFFLSPVFYSVDLQTSRLSEGVQWLAFLNPMTGLLCAYRTILMSDPTPSVWHVAVSFLVCWLVLLLGLVIFERVQTGFADEL